MSLTDFFVPCRLMDRISAPDGMGGITWHYVDGAAFDAGIVLDSSTQAVIAEQQGVKAMYKIVTTDMVELHFGDYVKRVNDGLIFRVTSNARDMTTPAVSVVKMRQVNAEVVTP